MSIPRSRPDPGGLGCVEFEYVRGGTLAYLAAWDVHHAKLFDRVEDTTGIVPFGRLVDQIMTVEPYRSAKTVYWIVDNGSSHAGKTSVKRMADKYPNATADPPPGARLVAEPDRDLLLDPATQGTDPERLRDPARARPPHHRFRPALPHRSPSRSSGPSPAPSSTP